MTTEPGKIFERCFPNQPEDLSRVTAEAMRFLEDSPIGAQALYVANLTVEEMGTNIIKYGYDDTAVHEILLSLKLLPTSLLVVLEDDGHEFNPLNWPDPQVNLPPEQRSPGGLGVHLVRKLAEEMTYVRSTGRNRLTVKIRSNPSGKG